ncbi:hypothetical protein RR46_14516 [Papilio xuthus]|uniref:Uncharacterized protein n=1 Tax=Papilio xuthus TaxID=66420 RepID=A0A194PCR7_PAPXU|nr:hypothetical protein RR46_14516 [Papilio xuthus]
MSSRPGDVARGWEQVCNCTERDRHRSTTPFEDFSVTTAPIFITVNTNCACVALNLLELVVRGGADNLLADYLPGAIVLCVLDVCGISGRSILAGGKCEFKQLQYCSAVLVSAISASVRPAAGGGGGGGHKQPHSPAC